MPVNNVALRVGQVWRTRDGFTATIEFIRTVTPCGWPVLCHIAPDVDEAASSLLAFDTNGRFTYPHNDHRYDMLELIEDAPAPLVAGGLSADDEQAAFDAWADAKGLLPHARAARWAGWEARAARTTASGAVDLSTKQGKLLALADRIDHEKLWRLAGMDHDKLTADQKDRMNAGVALRRYADIWTPGHWVISRPNGGVHYGASTLDKAVEMATKDEARRTANSAGGL